MFSYPLVTYHNLSSQVVTPTRIEGEQSRDPGSLSVLFQKLITEERTEMHLINLIVRALNSEGVRDAALKLLEVWVRDAALKLLEVCFKNEDLQGTAGEFLKVAANATVVDEGVQRNAGVRIQRAVKSVVLPQFWWAKNSGESSGNSGQRYG